MPIRPSLVLLPLLVALAPALTAAAPDASAEEPQVGITPDTMSVQVTHKGETVTIKREQDPESTIAAPYNKTSRPCPPFCVQPMDLAPGVETIGEMELLAYLQRMHEGDDDVLVIDSRTPDWVAEGTIPGAINIPWTQLDRSRASDQAIESILQLDFGVMRSGDFLDFNQAKTLVLFCNGFWCGQSPANIRSLLSLGYPAHKLKWYRGGMQAWHQLGLTTVGEAQAQ